MQVEIIWERLQHENNLNECKTKEDFDLENLRHELTLKEIEIIDELER